MMFKKTLLFLILNFTALGIGGLFTGDGVLKFSGEGLPNVTLYPESENCFFLKDFDVQFEFTTSDSFILINAGNIDWTAEKVKLKRR